MRPRFFDHLNVGLVSASLLASAAAAEQAAPAMRIKGAALSGAALQKVVTDYQKNADAMKSVRIPQELITPFQPAASAAVTVAEVPAVTATPPLIGTELPKSKNEKVAGLTRQAEEARFRGNWTEALSSWQTIETEATRQGDRETAAHAALNQARTLQLLPPKAGAEKTQQAEIVAKYRVALSGLPPVQQAFARNNLTVALIQQGEAKAAIVAMEEMDWATVEPAQVALCRFNFGRAQELQGSAEAAVEQYRKAIEAQADYAPAVDGAFRLLTAAGKLSDVAALGAQLVQRGQARAVLPQLQSALKSHPDLPQADRVLVVFARALAAASVTPDAFVKEDAGWLEAAAARAPALGKFVAELKLAFVGDFPASFRPLAQSERFPTWAASNSDREVLSLVLQNVGDFHARIVGEKSAALALSRYSAAWALDPLNTEAALYAAAILQEHRGLDRDAASLQVLVSQLFLVKGDKLAIAIKTDEDLKNIMRLHFVLASIFEHDKKWGPADNPATAAYQLSHAIALQELLGKNDVTLAPAPEVYARAGRVFQAANRAPFALEFYTKAAEGYLHFGASEQARESVTLALGIQGTRDAGYQARLDGVKRELQMF